MSYTDVTDEGIAHLATLGKLTYLDLSGADVDDAGLTVVGKLTELQELHVSFCRFGDAGLKAIAGLAHLKRLERRSHEGDERRTGCDCEAGVA